VEKAYETSSEGPDQGEPDLVKWRALYEDGTWLEEDRRPGGAYAAIDRSRLVAFAVLGSVNFQAAVGDRRLVWRQRTQLPRMNSCFLVALESQDRVDVDLFIITDGEVYSQKGYGPTTDLVAPDLLEFET
jgi:hypothetical protein